MYEEMQQVVASGMDDLGFSEMGFKIYPNPVKEALFVEVNSDAQQSIEVKIFDVAGRVVFNSAIELKQGAQKTSLNVSEMVNGVYFLKAGTHPLQKFFIGK